MTIVHPSKNKKIGWFVFFLIIFIFGGIYIYQYNQLAYLRHKTNALEKTLNNISFSNSVLKKELHQLINPKQLEQAAKEKGLILEERPKYISI